jgi:hypothetical protein
MQFFRSITVCLFLFCSALLFGQKGVKTGYSCKEITKQIELDEQNNNHPRAVRFLLFKEKECPTFSADDYKKLIFHLKNTISLEKNSASKTAYMDTICMVFQRMEAKKIYDTQNDLFWSTYILKSSKPDYTKADTLFTRNYKDKKSNFSELHVNLYYFTLYSLHSSATGEKQLEYRIRLINTFYDLKDHMSRTGMSPKATQNLETYLNNAIKGCNDICPSVNSIALKMAGSKDEKYTTLNNIRLLMESKDCSALDEYKTILDTLIQLKPTGEILSKKAGLVLASVKKCGSDEIHQKLNAFYAKTLIDQAFKMGYSDPKQTALLRSLLPTKNELEKAGIGSGEKFSLECWNTEIITP